MTVTVMNAAGELEQILTGKAPDRPELVVDNTKKADKEAQKEISKEPEKAKSEESKSDVKDDSDDVEGEDGLTPRQKRELSEKMLRAIGKKHREKKEAEEFATEQYNVARLAEQRAENLERQLQELRKQPVEKVEEPKEPQRADFETEEQYEDARIDWRAEQKFKQKQAEEAARREQERQAEVIKAATERLQKAADLVPDFQEVIDAVNLKIPGHIAGYMQESELIAEIGYHFAKHPEAVERLAKLSPAKALVEVGKIESTLTPFSKEKANGSQPSTSDGQSEKTTPSPDTSASSSKSRAPVITPLNTGSAAQVEKPNQRMSYQEARADWEKRRGVHLDRRRRH